MKENFKRVNEQHTYTTRSSQHNFVVPKIKGVKCSTFFYNAIKDWNDLPSRIKTADNLAQLKQLVKIYLTDKCNENEN